MKSIRKLFLLAFLCSISIIGGPAVPGASTPAAGRDDAIRTIAARGTASIALRRDGLILAWGNNSSGQLGDGTTVNRTVPVRVKGISNVIAIAGGRSHTLALRKNGTVWAWGNNKYGQLGNGSTVNKKLPVQVKRLSGIIAIAGGRDHSLALKKNGTVWAWGKNRNRQLGDGKKINRTAPVKVKTLSGVVAIAAGANHSLALKRNGTVWVWGKHKQGKPVRIKPGQRFMPVRVKKLTGIIKIASGENHSLALRRNGTVWQWGKCTPSPANQPKRVSRIIGIKAISAGNNRSMALSKDGTVWVWGNHGLHIPGKGNKNNRFIPLKVGGLTKVVAIAHGFNYSLVLKGDGSAMAWGNNRYGQLGDGTKRNRNRPVAVQIAPPPPSPPSAKIHTSAESIKMGEVVTLTWKTTRAKTTFIKPGIGTVAASGSVTVSPTEDTTYTITAKGPGGTAEAAVSIVVHPPPTVTIKAEPNAIKLGEKVTLTWSTTGAESTVINPGVGTVTPSGTVTVSPTEDTTYTIRTAGPGGTAEAAVSIVVHPPPTVTIKAEPNAIKLGEKITLTWTTTGAESTVINPGIGTVTPSGTVTVSPTEDTTYTITATGPGGTTATAITVEVTDPSTRVTMTAAPTIIKKGDTATLTWSTTRAEKVHIDNGIGTVDLNGTITVSPTHTTEYIVTAAGPAGSAGQRVTVKVEGNPAPPPAGTFAHRYRATIPKDATIETYDSKRFALITGRVRNRENNPEPGVTVSIHGHPQYGTTETDDDGRYIIPVEGGGALTQICRKKDRLTVHRKVNVPPNDTAISEPVEMLVRDKRATTMTLDGNPETVLIHKGSPVTDEFGGRTCTIVLKGDNRVYALDKKGNPIHELTTITTRATEYTAPQTMPARLPARSGYTYCVELEVDGVERVKFEKPIVTWVDNFLGFDVGMAVPVGYYDREKGIWVPSHNGIVVRLLDTDGDGKVDALDADGDRQADDLDGDGTTAGEVTGLDDPGQYVPGSTYWRVEITHFTPWDCNWPFGPPWDAILPKLFPRNDGQKEKNNDCQVPRNSYVEERSRIYHEDISIPGTALTLHYSSARVPGYKYRITVPASGDTLPESLESIIVRVDTAGNRFEKILEPAPGQTVEYTWDGLDSGGEPVTGSTTAHVAVGYKYGAVYYSPGNFDRAFDQAGSDVTAVKARQEVILWNRSDIVLAVDKVEGTIAEGWTISNHHTLSPMDTSTLLTGDGSTLRHDTTIINVVAGTGEVGFSSGNGGPAIEARFRNPVALATDAEGNYYISDTRDCRVRKVDQNGIITAFAGTGTYGYKGDGGPATKAWLKSVLAIAVDAEGNVYLADKGNDRIRKVDTNGIITTFAGESDNAGPNGGTALGAKITLPHGLTIDKAGNFYIAEWSGDYIRKIDRNGIITTIAGRNGAGYGGDGGPATDAKLYNPSGLVVDHLGNLYIADRDNHRVRKIDTTGIITTVAGNGTPGYGGDGGPGQNAMLNRPNYLAIDIAGNVYITDSKNYRIRKLDSNGIITTVAGNGSKTFSGEGGPATMAGLPGLRGIAMDNDGNLLMVNSKQIRKISSTSPFPGAEGIGDGLFPDTNGLGYRVSAAKGHHSTIDLDTGVVLHSFGYDDNKKLNTITDRFNNRITIERNANGKPTAIVSADGIRTQLTLDADNRLTNVTYPDGGEYRFEYTDDGLLKLEVEPNGNRYHQRYDTSGRLTGISDDEDGDWTYTRTVNTDNTVITTVQSAEGNSTGYRDHTGSGGEFISTVTGPSGAVSKFSQSGDHMTVQKNTSCGMIHETSYQLAPQHKYKTVKEMKVVSPAGLTQVMSIEKNTEDTNSDKIPDRITEKTTVNEKTTIYENDLLLSTKTQTTPEGRKTTVYYDSATLLTKRVAIPGFHDIEYAYDEKGRLTSVKTGDRESVFTYDEKGNLETVSDALQQTTTYRYDAMGRTIEVISADKSSTQFDYDKNGNMTRLINPLQKVHQFGFNKTNRNTTYKTPLSGSYTQSYDKDRRLLESISPSGRKIRNVYEKGRLKQVKTPEGDTDFTYLCGEKVGTISKNNETVSYTYDGPLVTAETISGTLSHTLTYDYNNDFVLTGITYAGGTIGFGHDKDGLLTEAGDFIISRNSQNGRPESIAGKNFKLDRTFNGYGEIESQTISIGEKEVASWALTFDNAGRISTGAETLNGVTTSIEYSYDTVGRLSTVIKGGELVEEYKYNANGSRIYEMNKARGLTGRTFAYSDEDHLMTAGSVSYQYDKEGFLTTKTENSSVTTYQYSSTGELLRAVLPDGRKIEYVHDPMGRRIAKKVNDIIVEKYLWQGLTTLLAVYDGNDKLLMRFEYIDQRMPVTLTTKDSTYYLTYDHIGSLRHVADNEGNSVKKIDYDAFGNIINDSNPSFTVPFGFAGGLHDRETGLVRFGLRDYEADTGRWTAKDPILFDAGDTDLYGYCLNDPINFVDPSGLLGIPKFAKKVLKKQLKKLPFKCAEKLLDVKIPTSPLAAVIMVFTPKPTANPEGEDKDGDGIPDYLDDSDYDGITDDRDEVDNINDENYDKNLRRLLQEKEKEQLERWKRFRKDVQMNK